MAEAATDIIPEQQIETPAPEAAPIVTPASEATVDWKAELAKADPDEVFTAMGFTDQQKSLYKDWKEKGDIKPWIEAYTTDPERMDATEILRRQIESDYAGIASPDEIKALTEQKLANYKLDATIYDEKEVKLDTLRLQKDVVGYRQQLKQEHAERIAKPAQAEDPAAKAAADVIAKRQDYIANSPVAQSILSNKEIIVGEGEHAFHIAIDNPEQTLSLVKAFQTADENGILDEQGNPDVAKAALILELSKDPYGWLEKAMGHGEKKNKVAEILAAENPKAAEPQTTGTAKKSVYEQLGEGKVVGGYR